MRIHEFAQRVHRDPATIRRWEREGKIKAKRLPSGHRYFDEDDVRFVLLGHFEEPPKRNRVVYCRVSSAGQKDDLQNQISAMETFCLNAGICIDEWIQEVGGGMNFKRKKFLALIDAILNDQIEEVIVAHKDRLTRFGFDLLDHLAQAHHCTIRVVNQQSLSPQAEMVNDLMAIIHTFSCRLYGLRKYTKSIKEDFPDAKTEKEELQ